MSGGGASAGTDPIDRPSPDRFLLAPDGGRRFALRRWSAVNRYGKRGWRLAPVAAPRLEGLQARATVQRRGTSKLPAQVPRTGGTSRARAPRSISDGGIE